jgi:transposase
MEGKMDDEDVYVGVDVSKERLDVALRPSGECLGEANDERAVSRLAWLPELGQLNRDEIAKLVGVAPMNDDSGKFHGRRHIAGGRAPLRKISCMATMGAMLHNPHLRAYYDRLRVSAKLHKIALVATMRKLLLILKAIIKTDPPWSEPCLENA